MLKNIMNGYINIYLRESMSGCIQCIHIQGMTEKVPLPAVKYIHTCTAYTCGMQIISKFLTTTSICDNVVLYIKSIFSCTIALDATRGQSQSRSFIDHRGPFFTISISQQNEPNQHKDSQDDEALSFPSL
jgi:hypothetical protein